MAATTMKAIVCNAYGPPERLELQEIGGPVPDADGVLLRVRAAAVNPADLHGVKGGLLIRLTSGLRKPKRSVPGVDVAGVVEAVGESVTDFRPGDKVFGAAAEALAQRVVGGKNFVGLPANLTFEQGAAIPIAGITALQALRDKGHIRPGQTVLINGASGGVGTFAVQIATAYGAKVTGVCSSRNIEMVRSLGAHQVIDYSRQDFDRLGEQYDLVLDLVGNRSLAELLRATKPDGTLVLSGGGHDRGHGARGLRPLLLIAGGLLRSKLVSQRIAFFIAQVNRQDLLTLKELIEAGKVTPVIDRTYPLSEAPDALRYLEAGHARGKVVVTVSS